MKIGSARWFILLTALAPIIVIAAKDPSISVNQLKDVLSKQGFTGMLNDEAHFSKIGFLTCGVDRYQVFCYEWSESHQPSLAIHAQYRVLFVENGSKYVGSYVVQDHPKKISHDAVIFRPAGRDSNEIKCGANGLPGKVFLNGTESELFK
ncbi:MAG: hypothetical protein KGN79_09010 [Acidobacteriota bacterium]|nr:hypothetical protein [Acidobacteriota bacterium]